MPDVQLMARAAAPLVEIIRNIKPDQLDARTPCTEYDVRKLVNHLLFWGPSLEGAARKEAVPPPAEAETDLNLTEGDWAAALGAHVERTVAAWSAPGPSGGRRGPAPADNNTRGRAVPLDAARSGQLICSLRQVAPSAEYAAQPLPNRS